MSEIQINSGMANALDVIKSLILSEYKVNIEAVKKKYPYESSIDYFKISYTK